MYRHLPFFLLLIVSCFQSNAQHLEFVTAIRNRALPIDSVLSFHSTFNGAKGKQILKKLNSYEALGLGEASHGTHEYFVAKANLIKLLLSAGHYDRISLEAPYAEVEILNNFLLNEEEDDHKDGIAVLPGILKSFRQYTYETREFDDLIRSLKAYNKRIKKKILFYGADFQSPYQVLINLKAAVKDNMMATRAMDSLQHKFDQLSNALYAHQIDEETYQQLLHDSDILLRGLNNNSDPDILQNVKSYRQFLLLNAPAVTKEGLEKASALRDSLMASNVAEEIKKGHKFIIWAHNGHVQKTPNTFSKTMGQHLWQNLGQGYAALGFSTYEGYFTAYNPQQQGVVDTNPLHLPEAHQIESLLKQVNQPNYFFESKGLTLPAAVTEYRLQVYGLTENQFQLSNMINDFDYIIFLTKTTGSSNYYLKNPANK
jgi:erythromycin esterase